MNKYSLSYRPTPCLSRKNVRRFHFLVTRPQVRQPLAADEACFAKTENRSLP